MEKQKNERGAITLEACVSVTIFTLFMLFFIGLFSMFHTQQTMSHAIIQSTQSLALETYGTKKLEFEIGGGSGITSLVTEAIAGIYDLVNQPSENFSDDSFWYNTASIGVAENAAAVAAKARFIGYLTGGDEEKADALLKNMRVVDGLDGLDFSETKVENNVLYTTVKYKLEFMFTVGDIGVMDMQQTFSAKLWL